MLPACRRGAHGASSLQAWRTRCFQPAGVAHTVLPACRLGAHGAFEAAITRGDATRHMLRSRRQLARASLRSALVDAGWACALRPQERRRSLVRPRRRSAAKPERTIDDFAGRAVWHYPPAQQGVVAATNARCALRLQAERAVCSQTAAVARTARSMPPSPEVMPHGTFGEAVANLLALRCAPRSWAQSGACALRARGRSQGPVRSALVDADRRLCDPRVVDAGGTLCAHEGGAQRSLSD